MSLTRPQTHMLSELVVAGQARLDAQGRVCVPPINRPIPGSSYDWMCLVAHGAVAGEGGLILPTEAGRELVATRAGGTTREAQA